MECTRTRIATFAIAILLASLCVAEEQASSELSSISGDSRVPRQTVVPTYPEKARQQRIEGTVQVCFNIDRKGKTYRISVRTSTHRLFEKPSIKAVRGSSYVPLAEDVEVPGIKSCRTFHFFLDPVEIDDNNEPDPTGE